MKTKSLFTRIYNLFARLFRSLFGRRRKQYDYNALHAYLSGLRVEVD